MFFRCPGMSPLTMGLTAHSTWKYKTPQGDGVTHIMNPDCYTGLFGGTRDSPIQTEGWSESGSARAVEQYMGQAIVLCILTKFVFKRIKNILQ